MKPPAQASVDEDAQPLPSSGSRRRSGGVTFWAFVASAVLHAVAVILYPVLTAPEPTLPPSPGPTAAPEPQGMEVLRLVEVSVAASEVVEPEETEEPPEPPAPEAAPAIPEAAALGAVPGEPMELLSPPALRAAERLRPRPGDPRLWEELPPELTEPAPETLAQLRLVWTLEARADSAAAAAEAQRAATDWTFTDDEGKRWGFSPGKIHLGDLTLPFPFSFGAPYNSEAARRARTDREIDRAAGRGAVWESVEERAEAVRERKDREREEKKKKTEKPDSTGGGSGSGG